MRPYRQLSALLCVWCLGITLVTALACNQLRRANTAADAICSAADAWESEAPELVRLRELCAAKADTEELQQQFNVCVATVRPVVEQLKEEAQ